MALPVWPISLGELRGEAQGGGTDALVAAPLVSQFDDGPDRVRRRHLFRQTVFRIVLKLDFAGLATFQDFIQTDLNDISRRFTAPVLLADGTVGTRTCRISAPPSLSYPDPVIPQVAFPLIVWNWR